MEIAGGQSSPVHLVWIGEVSYTGKDGLPVVIQQVACSGETCFPPSLCVHFPLSFPLLVVIGLSGGSLPKFFVQAAALLDPAEVNWKRVKFVFCDERLVPFDDADSTFKLYREGVAGKVDGITEDSFVVIDPALEVGACAEDYAARLKALGNFGSPFPAYDLLLLGMGPDGHTWDGLNAMRCAT